MAGIWAAEDGWNHGSEWSRLKGVRPPQFVREVPPSEMVTNNRSFIFAPFILMVDDWRQTE